METEKWSSLLKPPKKEKIIVSQYLPGFFQRNIPWWPFIIFGTVTSAIIGLATNINLGFPPGLIPAGVIGIFIGILVLQKPEIGAYLLIISVFTNISDILTDRGLPAINRPLIAVTIGSVMINYYLKTGAFTKFPKISSPQWALTGYFLAIVFSVLVLPDRTGAFATISDVTKDILVGISVYIAINSQDKWRKGIYVLLTTITILATLGVIKSLTGTSETFFDLARNSLFGQVGSGNELRYGGPIGEPNLWGQILVSTMPFVLYLITSNNTRSIKSMFFLIISGVLITLALIFTGSRGAFVALLIITPLFAIDQKIKLSTLLTGFIIFVIVINLLPDSYAKRFATLGNQETLSQDDAVIGRSTTMQIGWEMFTENPILGVGFGRYQQNYWQIAQNLGLESNANNIDYTKDAQLPHSLYLEILSETGLIGLITFMLYCYALLYGLYRIREQTTISMFYKDWLGLINALSLSILTFLISGFFLHGVFFRFIWILVGLAMAAISIVNQAKTESFQKTKPLKDKKKTLNY